MMMTMSRLIGCISIAALLTIATSFHANLPYSKFPILKISKSFAEKPNPFADVLPTQGMPQKPWEGSREILPRKKQVPLPEYGPKDVIRICLQALQNNDDPQLDHGSCVVLEFKSPQGVLSQESLDPAAYGRFLRTSEPYGQLLDFKSAELLGSPEPIGGSVESIKQGVKLRAYENYEKTSKETLFDFYLSRVDGKWLIDAILARPQL